MNDIHKEILKLTAEWYELISGDINKDRDCHWRIETCWSYGKEPEYRIYHYGYICDNIEIACDSYETALKELKKLIQRCIEREKSVIKLQ